MNKKMDDTKLKLTGTVGTRNLKEIKGSGPVRAKRTDVAVPVKATTHDGQQERAIIRDQLKLTGMSNTNRAELKKIREQIRDLSRQSGPSYGGRLRQDRIENVMAQLKDKFGDSAVQQAVKDFNLTFNGITNDDSLYGKDQYGSKPFPIKVARNSRRPRSRG
jgi:hypothetical protein